MAMGFPSTIVLVYSCRLGCHACPAAWPSLRYLGSSDLGPPGLRPIYLFTSLLIIWTAPTILQYRLFTGSWSDCRYGKGIVRNTRQDVYQIIPHADLGSGSEEPHSHMPQELAVDFDPRLHPPHRFPRPHLPHSRVHQGRQ